MVVYGEVGEALNNVWVSPVQMELMQVRPRGKRT